MALQVVLFLIFGVGLLAVDYRALTTGRLPCGPRGLSGPLTLTKDAQPVAFWLMFGVYGLGGAWLVIFAVRLLAGQVEPLPLR